MKHFLQIKLCALYGPERKFGNLFEKVIDLITRMVLESHGRNYIYRNVPCLKYRLNVL